MRHRVAGKKLNRTSSHRKALAMNLMRAFLIEWQGKGHIVTTRSKAKFIQPKIEKLISLSRSKTVHNVRRAMALIGDRDAVRVLFDEIGPYYSERPGGYTRVLRLVKPRLGDASVRAYLGYVREDDEYPEGDCRAKDTAESAAAVEAVVSEEAASDEIVSAEVASEEAASEESHGDDADGDDADGDDEVASDDGDGAAADGDDAVASDDGEVQGASAADSADADESDSTEVEAAAGEKSGAQEASSEAQEDSDSVEESTEESDEESDEASKQAEAEVEDSSTSEQEEETPPEKDQ